MGDKSRRTCAQYAVCPQMVQEWEDETGAQFYCQVCGAAIFIDPNDY